jgi:hypothetical protein
MTHNNYKKLKWFPAKTGEHQITLYPNWIGRAQKTPTTDEDREMMIKAEAKRAKKRAANSLTMKVATPAPERTEVAAETGTGTETET